MRFTTSMCLLASAAYASAAVNARQATTITDSNGDTIVNSGIADATTMASMTMTEAASTSESRPPGAESSLAIIIDGSTMYEPGVMSGGSTDDASSSATASAETTGTDTSSAWGSRITQAPVIIGGVAVAALLAV